MKHRHDPEVDAAAYVTGVMSPHERRRFDRHLLTCETCWHEVRLGREGRRLAELGRQAAPAGLRESVRAAVSASVSPQVGVVDLSSAVPTSRSRRLGRHRVWVAAASLAAVVALVAVSVSWSARTHEPAAISVALDAYHRSVVTTSDHHMMPPDLTMLGLAPTGAQPMALADMPVEAFAYRSTSGGRLLLFMAHVPFPRAAQARSNGGAAWRAQHDGMTMVSGTSPVSYLVVSTDSGLVDRFLGAVTDGSVVIT